MSEDQTEKDIMSQESSSDSDKEIEPSMFDTNAKRTPPKGEFKCTASGNTGSRGPFDLTKTDDGKFVSPEKAPPEQVKPKTKTAVTFGGNKNLPTDVEVPTPTSSEADELENVSTEPIPEKRQANVGTPPTKPLSTKPQEAQAKSPKSPKDKGREQEKRKEQSPKEKPQGKRARHSSTKGGKK